MALQPENKAELQQTLGKSLEAAVGHLAWLLGLKGSVKKPPPRLFTQHELDIAHGKQEAAWESNCSHDLGEVANSLEYCAIRKLQALDALCMAPPEARKPFHKGIRAALDVFEQHMENIPGLNIRRDPLPERTDGEGFTYEQKHVGSSQKVLKPTVQSVAMAAITRCGAALGRPPKASALLQWFVAAEVSQDKMKPSFKEMSHHMLGVVWHALAFVETQVPPAKTDVAAKAKKAIAGVEKAMSKQFSRGQKIGVWSYSGAMAVAIRANRTELSERRRSSLRELAAAHGDRFRETLLAGMNVTEMCTCGPVAGLAPLATLLQDSKLAVLVLRLMDKDVTLFQVRAGEDSAQGAEPGLLASLTDFAKYEGAFLRSQRQLELEGRPRRLRIDDTASCIVALIETLRMVEGMPTVELPEGKAAPQEANAEVGGESRSATGNDEL